MTTLDTRTLAAAVRTKRGDQSLRDVVSAIGEGVSVSTLSRVEQGKGVEIATYLALCDWLEVPPQTFFIAASSSVEQTSQEVAFDVLQRIEMAMRDDALLPLEFVKATMHLIRLIHHQNEKAK